MHTTNDLQSLRLTISKNHILEEGDPSLLDDPRRESIDEERAGSRFTDLTDVANENRDLQVLNRHYESMKTL